jgi:hypothetical protein
MPTQAGEAPGQPSDVIQRPIIQAFPLVMRDGPPDAGPAAPQAAAPAPSPVEKYERAIADALKPGATPDLWKIAAEYLNDLNLEGISNHLSQLTDAQITLIHQGAVDNGKVGPDANVALLTCNLLTSFAGKFKDAAELIRRSPEAITLIKDAVHAGVKFGGFAEDGPQKNAWPYTSGDTVYVPKASTDKMIAMNNFLFELNNGLNRKQFDAINNDAKAGTVDAKQYAYRMTAVEVEGMLRLAGVWLATKKSMGNGAALDKYDDQNYVNVYRAVSTGKMTKDQLVHATLKGVYPAGINKGKTVEQYYMEGYAKSFGQKGGKADAGAPPPADAGAPRPADAGTPAPADAGAPPPPPPPLPPDAGAPPPADASTQPPGGVPPPTGAST